MLFSPLAYGLHVCGARQIADVRANDGSDAAPMPATYDDLLAQLAARLRPVVMPMNESALAALVAEIAETSVRFTLGWVEHETS